MIQNPLTDTEFDLLKRIWSEADIIHPGSTWTLMDGGRSNIVWRVDSPDQGSLVCKLFLPDSSSPLFANDGTREALALSSLKGSNIAPQLVAFQESILGISLISQHVEGSPWRGDLCAIAKLMAHLHRQPLPLGLPNSTTTSDSLISEGHAMLREPSAQMPPAPFVPKLPRSKEVFLHGDIVPGNILVTKNSLYLIDWQCPAIGDPSSDIAVFLSPAMQVIYGYRELTKHEVNAFLKTYEDESGDATSVTRYRALAPLYHWRMAAYCLWRSARGEQDYARAFDLEIAHLNKC